MVVEQQTQHVARPETVELSATGTRQRYRIVQRDGISAIVCTNAPHLLLRYEPGLTVNARGRRRYPARTIFLDGVFTGAPFYDNARKQYSLDHHAGCVRSFTLATCEQAAVMLIQGLPLHDGTWVLFINALDLDAVLAAWLLMNHAEVLRDDATLLREVMPLIRVEGIIDTHGLDRDVLTALPRAAYDLQKQRLDSLLEQWRGSNGDRSDTSLSGTLCLLEAVDRMLMPASVLERLLEFEEIDRAALQGGRIAVLCRSTRSIYDVEAHLKTRYPGLLGVIVLDKGDGQYSLQLVDRFMRRDLNALYDVLNRNDPAAQRASDGGNLWGGSAIIGGSPRSSGSRLNGREVLVLAARVFGPRRSWWRRLVGWLWTAGRRPAPGKA